MRPAPSSESSPLVMLEDGGVGEISPLDTLEMIRRQAQSKHFKTVDMLLPMASKGASALPYLVTFIPLGILTLPAPENNIPSCG